MAQQRYWQPARFEPIPLSTRRIAQAVIARSVLDAAGFLDSCRPDERRKMQADALSWLGSPDCATWLELSGLMHWLSDRLRQPLPVIDRSVIDTQRRSLRSVRPCGRRSASER